MIKSEMYTDIFSEYFDMHNYNTNTYISALNEEEKDNTIIVLANRLYKMITNKIDKIDYGTIPLSKGDITKFKYFERMRDSITTIRDIARKSGDGIEETTVIEKAFDNVIANRDLFVKGYKLNIDIIKTFYENIVLSIIADISYFTAICIEFIKNPKTTIKIEYEGLVQFRTKFGFIHNVLIKFNDSCDKGEIEKAFSALISGKSHKFITGGLAVAAAPGFFGSLGEMAVLLMAAFVLIKSIIPILREIIYFFFAARVSLEDYFNVQADLLEANADSLKKNKDTDKDIIDSQIKWADRFRKYANFFAIDYIPAKNKAEKEIKKDTKKINVDTDDINNIEDDDDSNVLF